MVSDKELITQALENYATKTVDKLFGFNSIAAQTLVRYGVRNLIEKYSQLIGVFTDTSGNINVKLIIDAIKSEIKSRGGLKIWNIKLSETDFEEIFQIYERLKSNNIPQ